MSKIIFIEVHESFYGTIETEGGFRKPLNICVGQTWSLRTVSLTLVWLTQGNYKRLFPRCRYNLKKKKPLCFLTIGREEL